MIFRGNDLARSDTPSLTALRHALNKAENEHEIDWDVAVLLPCTNPLRTGLDINKALAILDQNPKTDSVIGVSECEPVERIKVIRDGLLMDTFPEPQDGQRQYLPKYFVRNGSIYAVRKRAIDRLFGHEQSMPYVMPKERGVNIDDLLDWKLAEVLLKEREGLL